VTFLGAALVLALIIGTVIGVAWADYRLDMRIRRDEEDRFKFRMRNRGDDDAENR
jgi:hypothetical protein